MFGLFRPSCPVDPVSKAWVEYRLFWLARTLGHATLGRIKVVRPTPEYLPANFDRGEAAARDVFDRVAGWMGVADASAIALRFFDRGPDGLFDRPFTVPENRKDAQAFYLGYYVAGNSVTIWVDQSLLGDGEALVATMAHELAHARLLGDGLIAETAADMEQVTDLLTVYHGLGVFAGNSVIRERYETSVNSYRWGIRRSGYLSESVFGYALAVCAFARGESDSVPWASDLRLNVRDAFRQGLRYLLKTGDSLFTPAQYRGEEPAELAPALESVAGDLSAPGAGRRVAALWELRRRGPQSAAAVAAIAAALRDKDVAVRREAAWNLIALGPAARPAAPSVVEALDSESSATVRQLLAATLPRVKAEPPAAVTALLSALRAEAPAVLSEAVRALGEYTDDLPTLGRVEEVAEATRLLVHHPEPDLAEEALRLLARLGPAAGPFVPELLQKLREDSQELRPALLRALGRAGVADKPVLAALRSGAKARDPLAAAAAYDALADLGPAARASLEELPEPRSSEPTVWVVRAAAHARVLGRVGEAVPVFRQALADDPDTLPAIAAALRTIGPAVAPALIAELGATDPAVRAFATWALGRFQPLPDGAETALRKLAADPDERVAVLARAALGTPPATPPTGRGAAWRLQSCPPQRPDAELENPPPPDLEALLAELVTAACHRPDPAEAPRR